MNNYQNNTTYVNVPQYDEINRGYSTNQTNKENQNCEEDSVKNFLFGCSAFCIYFWMSPIPIVTLALLGAYGDEIVCANRTSDASINLAVTLGIRGWLSVQSVLLIVYATFMVCMSYLLIKKEQKTFAFGCSYFMKVLYSLWLVVWAIVGGVLLWRDCPDLEPSHINTIMWINVIMSMIGAFAVLFSGQKKE